MPIQVYDYRSDLTNVVVRPEIRSRFRRVELGPVPRYHSHDLGGETFIVMDGQIEFTVDGESAVCTTGQAIYVPPRTTHAVRAVGDAPGVMYLSVAPHVEPTHTRYDAQGNCLPPRYGVWREAGGGTAPSSESTEALLAAYRQAAQRLAELARTTAEAAEAANAAGAPKPMVDALWDSLRPTLQQVETLERTWNELALRATP